METAILVIFLTLLFSAFFSGLEIAFLSSNKLRIELKSNQGARWAQLCSRYFKTPSKFISTVLVGNNISIVIYGIFIEELLRTVVLKDLMTDMGKVGSLLLATLISTLIVLIFAEFLPKALFRINPSGILRVLIYPFQFFAVILAPLVRFVLWLAKLILNTLLRKEFTEESPAFSRVDLDHYITESQIHKTEEERDVDTDIIKNALEFGNVQIRDCMIPRTSIIAVDMDVTIDELEKVFIDTGHSKILVFKENIDNIIGYVHHIDLFRKPDTLKSILIPVMITNESKPANDMLNDFTRNRKSIALVVDEFGGTAGIVTTEDIIEEIFGEIEDEHDDSDGTIDIRLNDFEFELSSSLEVDYLNETYDLNIPEGDYETLGGFIISICESIPEQGTSIETEEFLFTILASSNNRIESVHLKVIHS